MQEGVCKYCRSRIFWVQNDFGKNIAIDADAPCFAVTLNASGQQVASRSNSWVTHAATCRPKQAMKTSTNGGIK